MTTPGLTIHVNQIELAEPVTPEEVTAAVNAVIETEGEVRGEISVTFVEPQTIAALNEKHLNRQGPTDVIAFLLGEPDEMLGDVYICPEVARGSAAEYGVELREELLRLVVHGVLHVLGHDHPEGPERETSEMFRRQEAILSHLL